MASSPEIPENTPVSDRPGGAAVWATTPEAFNERAAGRFPGLVGFTVTVAEPGHVAGRMPIRPELWAPNGYLHAAAVTALADTCSGYGSLCTLPAGATGFTTAELKMNLFSTLREGVALCEARMLHGGRTTQVWDATISDEATGKTLAVFRCTQIILWPRPA